MQHLLAVETTARQVFSNLFERSQLRFRRHGLSCRSECGGKFWHFFKKIFDRKNTNHNRGAIPPPQDTYAHFWNPPPPALPRYTPAILLVILYPISRLFQVGAGVGRYCAVLTCCTTEVTFLFLRSQKMCFFRLIIFKNTIKHPYLLCPVPILMILESKKQSCRHGIESPMGPAVNLHSGRLRMSSGSRLGFAHFCCSLKQKYLP